MRRNIILFVALFCISQMGFAQGEATLKMASKKYSEFVSDPFNNTGALKEASSLIDEVMADEAIMSDPSNVLSIAEMYANSADAQIKAILLNPELSYSDPMAAVNAAKTYAKVFPIADKKKYIKNAVKGLQEAETSMATIGSALYNSQDYTGAYKNFAGELMAYDVLKAQDEDSRLDDEAILGERQFFAGLTAYYAKENEAAIKYLTAAKESGTNDAALYQILHESYAATGDDEKAVEALTMGREAFPDDNGLLFAEINYYLKKGEQEKMISKLEEALEKEPENQSIVLTLGQVYDQLQQKASAAGEIEKGEEYFEKAHGYYTSALEKDPGNFDLTYALGALYYNKAASMNGILSEVADDMSKEGEAKYNAIKSEMDGLFDSALPYFKKADEINSQDRNTLIALKEIYARKGDFEKSGEYKARLDAL